MSTNKTTKHTIYDVKKNETRPVNNGVFTLRQWVCINFAGWGFYTITKMARGYDITDRATGEVLYQVR